jgi:hypothetical protein
MFDADQTDQLRDELEQLLAEPAPSFDDLAAARAAYVGAAVTEIASLRAELSGRQWG